MVDVSILCDPSFMSNITPFLNLYTWQCNYQLDKHKRYALSFVLRIHMYVTMHIHAQHTVVRETFGVKIFS